MLLRNVVALSLILFTTLLFTVMPPPVSHALVEMDAKGVNQAVRYGMERGRYGISEVLGPNWLEGDRGILLNIYSPFMLVATYVAKRQYPANPTDKEVDEAKKRSGKIIRSVTNPRYPQEVKFVLSFLGNDSKFHRTITAEIKGIGHGKKFTLKPSRKLVPRFADGLPGAVDADGEPTSYEAVNAYYFPIKTMAHLDEFDITFYDYSDESNANGDSSDATENKSGDKAFCEETCTAPNLTTPRWKPVTFHINNNRIL